MQVNLYLPEERASELPAFLDFLPFPPSVSFPTFYDCNQDELFQWGRIHQCGRNPKPSVPDILFVACLKIHRVSNRVCNMHVRDRIRLVLSNIQGFNFAYITKSMPNE